MRSFALRDREFLVKFARTAWYQVAANQSVLSATRLYGLSTFVATLAVAVEGLLIIVFKRNKPFMVAGAVILLISLACMTRFRGPENTVGELAALQVFRGAGYGAILLFYYAGFA